MKAWKREGLEQENRLFKLYLLKHLHYKILSKFCSSKMNCEILKCYAVRYIGNIMIEM